MKTFYGIIPHLSIEIKRCNFIYSKWIQFIIRWWKQKVRVFKVALLYTWKVKEISLLLFMRKRCVTETQEEKISLPKRHFRKFSDYILVRNCQVNIFISQKHFSLKWMEIKILAKKHLKSLPILAVLYHVTRVSDVFRKHLEQIKENTTFMALCKS